MLESSPCKYKHSLAYKGDPPAAKAVDEACGFNATKPAIAVHRLIQQSYYSTLQHMHA
jgi:hypothetical protein